MSIFRDTSFCLDLGRLIGSTFIVGFTVLSSVLAGPPMVGGDCWRAFCYWRHHHLTVGVFIIDHVLHWVYVLLCVYLVIFWWSVVFRFRETVLADQVSVFPLVIEAQGAAIDCWGCHPGIHFLCNTAIWVIRAMAAALDGCSWSSSSLSKLAKSVSR